MKRFKLLLKMSYFMSGYVYRQAALAVEEVSKNVPAQILGEKEGMTSYCPRCGQRPTHDVRHDEAFEIAFGKIDPPRRSKDLHFAIELSRWLA